MKQYMYVESTPDVCGGKPRIAGCRIPVQDVAFCHKTLGLSPEGIAAAYPGVTLAKVYAALTYYYDHRDDIHRSMEEASAYAARLEAEHPLDLSTEGVPGNDPASWLRLYLDESCHRELARELHLAHIDRELTVDAKQTGAADRALLAYAHQSSRVLFTHDSAFHDLHQQGLEHAGILYCPPGRYPLEEQVRRLRRAWALPPGADLCGQLRHL